MASASVSVFVLCAIRTLLRITYTITIRKPTTVTVGNLRTVTIREYRLQVPGYKYCTNTSTVTFSISTVDSRQSTPG